MKIWRRKKENVPTYESYYNPAYVLLVGAFCGIVFVLGIGALLWLVGFVQR